MRNLLAFMAMLPCIAVAQLPEYGCTDSGASNYDASANTDDNSCCYPSHNQSSLTACDSTYWNGVLINQPDTYYYLTTVLDTNLNFLLESPFLTSSEYQNTINQLSNDITLFQNFQAPATNLYNNENANSLWGEYYEDFSDNQAQGWSWSGYVGACCATPLSASTDGNLTMSHCCGYATMEVTSPNFSAPSGHFIESVSFSGGASANGINSTSSNNVRFNNGSWQTWTGNIPEHTTTIQFKFNAHSQSWYSNITIDDFKVTATNSTYGWALPLALDDSLNLLCAIEYEALDIDIEACGCTDQFACNYSNNATSDDSTCFYPPSVRESIIGCDSVQWTETVYTSSDTLTEVIAASLFTPMIETNIYGSDSLQYYINTIIRPQIEGVSTTNLYSNENANSLWGEYYEDFSDNEAQGWSWSGYVGACCATPLSASTSGNLTMSHCCGYATMEVTSPNFTAPSDHFIESVSFSGGASANGINSTSSNNVRFNNGSWQTWTGNIPEHTTTIQFKFNAHSQSWYSNITIDNFKVTSSNSLLGLTFPPQLPDSCLFEYDITNIQVLSGGCTDTTACNFDPLATCDDGSCRAPDECGICIGTNPGPGAIYECGCHDIAISQCDCDGNELDAIDICGGNCVADVDADGICDADEIAGCTDNLACNFNPIATLNNDICEFGCLYCGEGTVWNSASSTCIPDILSGDFAASCTVMNLQELAQNYLLLLEQLTMADSLLAICNSTAVPDADSPWTCGDPLTYWDYDYATVLIGDQCWFAENLKTAVYENGDAIAAGLTDGEWTSTTSGATSTYGEGSSTCYESSPDIDACDEAESLQTYGRLYNWYAVNDSRGLCPSDWHVPSDSEWTALVDHVGAQDFNGSEGTALKAESAWSSGGNGTNDFGFTALPGGHRFQGPPTAVDDGTFNVAGYAGYWWSTTALNNTAWRYAIYTNNTIVGREDDHLQFGFSVRCIKD